MKQIHALLRSSVFRILIELQALWGAAVMLIGMLVSLAPLVVAIQSRGATVPYETGVVAGVFSLFFLGAFFLQLGIARYARKSRAEERFHQARREEEK